MLVMEAVGFEPEYEILDPNLTTWYLAEGEDTALEPDNRVPGYKVRGFKIIIEGNEAISWQILGPYRDILYQEEINEEVLDNGKGRIRYCSRPSAELSQEQRDASVCMLRRAVDLRIGDSSLDVPRISFSHFNEFLSARGVSIG